MNNGLSERKSIAEHYIHRKRDEKRKSKVVVKHFTNCGQTPRLLSTYVFSERFYSARFPIPSSLLNFLLYCRTVYIDYCTKCLRKLNRPRCKKKKNHYVITRFLLIYFLNLGNITTKQCLFLNNVLNQY